MFEQFPQPSNGEEDAPEIKPEESFEFRPPDESARKELRDLLEKEGIELKKEED